MEINTSKPPKILIIGLDGATFDVILPMISKGLLPNLARLMQEGTWAKLESTIHPITPQAWTSFMTGKNAGKHGIYDFTERDPVSYNLRCVNGSFRKAKTLWSILGDSGKKVGIMNVPFTYPPEQVNGFMISGFDAPGIDSQFVSPPDLYREILKNTGHYELRGAFPIGKRKDQYSMNDVYKVVNNHTVVAQYLLKKYPSDLFMIVYSSTDHVQHLFWQHWEEKQKGVQDDEVDRFADFIPLTYQKIDQAMGELIESMGSDTLVMVMSDHGGGKLKKVFYLNRWLEEQGWLVYKKPQGGTSNKVLHRVKHLTKRYLPRRYRDLIKTYLPSFREMTESYLFSSNIDWMKTKAYAGGMYGNIYVNLKGREGSGIVQPGSEYELFREEITEALLKLRDPESGELIVENAHKKEALFKGSHTEGAPDILIEWKDYAYFTKGTLLGEKGQVFGEKLYIDSSEFEHTGTHRQHGIFIATGPGINKNGQIQDLGINDIAPTILYAFGHQVPSDMDGRVITELFDENFVKEHPVQFNEGAELESPETTDLHVYSDEEQKEIEERLKGLGYL